MSAARHYWPWLLLLVEVSVSCRTTPAAGPVPVQGSGKDVSALAGEWSGRYWSKATGRRGTIRFNLPERADTGFGEVEIAFSPSLHLLVEDTEENKYEPKPCTVIDITLLRVEGGRVRGSMAPYWDPDCDCRARTVFEGKISGDRITGTFTTQRASTDRRLLNGEWLAARERGK